MTFSQKVNFDASLLVMQFYFQLVIRYHVTRAEAETCYGCLRVGIKIQKEVCLLRRSGKIQDKRNFPVVWPIDISPEVIAEMFNAIHWKMETALSNIKSQQKHGNQAW